MPTLLCVVGLFCLRLSAAWAAIERVSEDLKIDCQPPLELDEAAAAGAGLLAGWQSWSLVWR